jgi:hypothetical protein
MRPPSAAAPGSAGLDSAASRCNPATPRAAHACRVHVPPPLPPLPVIPAGLHPPRLCALLHHIYEEFLPGITLARGSGGIGRSYPTRYPTRCLGGYFRSLTSASDRLDGLDGCRRDPATSEQAEDSQRKCDKHTFLHLHALRRRTTKLSSRGRRPSAACRC